MLDFIREAGDSNLKYLLMFILYNVFLVFLSPAWFKDFKEIWQGRKSKTLVSLFFIMLYFVVLCLEELVAYFLWKF